MVTESTLHSFYKFCDAFVCLKFSGPSLGALIAGEWVLECTTMEFYGLGVWTLMAAIRLLNSGALLSPFQGLLYTF